MKLDELLGVKKFYDKHLDDVKKAFVANGSKFKKLGLGATGEAYGKNDLVYKFWLEDSAYEKYVEYCLKHQNNPHVPKFLSKIKSIHSFFLRPSEFPDKIKYIKMEKLTDIGMEDKVPGLELDDSSKPVIIDRWGWDPLTYGFFVDNVSQIISEEGNAKKSLDAFCDLLKEKNVKADNNWKKEFLEIFELMFDIEPLFIGDTNNNRDYHIGNFMKRGKTLVITDPYSNYKSMIFSGELADKIYRMKYTEDGDEKPNVKSGVSYKKKKE